MLQIAKAKNYRMIQKLNYDPRTVPPAHTLMYPFPYLSVTDDTMPHGWRRYDEAVVARPQSGLSNVHCQVRELHYPSSVSMLKVCYIALCASSTRILDEERTDTLLP